MSVISVRRGFHFSPGELIRDAQRLHGALQDATLGPPVVAFLPENFLKDFEIQIALVAKLGTDQSGAIGSLGKLTLAQEEALADYVNLGFVARRAAKHALAGQDTVLRSEFQVGAQGSRDISRILDRARKLLAACQKYAVVLSPHGMTAAGIARLQTAVETLNGVDREHTAASDGKLGLTAERTAVSNRLYRQCFAVQNAARIAYGNAPVAGDPATVERRARFLLDEFPPKFIPKGSAPEPVAAPVTAPAPVTVT